MKQVKIEIKTVNATGAEEVKGTFNFALENERAVEALKDTVSTVNDLKEGNLGKPINGIEAGKRNKFVFPFQAYGNREVWDLVAKYGKFFMKNTPVD